LLPGPPAHAQQATGHVAKMKGASSFHECKGFIATSFVHRLNFKKIIILIVFFALGPIETIS
jgi:hypothetical protein